MLPIYFNTVQCKQKTFLFVRAYNQIANRRLQDIQTDVQLIYKKKKY